MLALSFHIEEFTARDNNRKAIYEAVSYYLVTII